MDNHTVDLHRAIQALKTSYNNNVEDNKNINQNLHHKNIWGYVVTGGLGLVAGIILIMGFITWMIYKRQKKDITGLVENGVGQITVNSTTSRFSEAFNEMDDNTKKVVLLAMQLEKKDRQNILLQKMNEVANEQGLHLKEEDLPEVIINYFDPKHLKRTLKGINIKMNTEEGKA